jgi:S-adenosylmethionine hydrolase
MTAGRIICFLTDYGQADEFVGIVHRVIAGIDPGLPVIDITHQIPRHDVRAGALTLWRSAPWLGPGVILGVVDPGVGTRRRSVAFEVADANTTFVGPDNGLLLPAATRLGPITIAVELGTGEFGPVSGATDPRSRTGATFAGRDIFAPAAARLAMGTPIRALGPLVDPATLMGEPVPRPEPAVREGKPAVLAEVLWIDQFGNLQLNAGPDDVTNLGDASPVQAAPPHAAPPHAVPPHAVAVHAAGRTREARIVDAYGDLAPGELGLVIDSYGLLSISLNSASAAAVLVGVAAGTPVWLTQGAAGMAGAARPT